MSEWFELFNCSGDGMKFAREAMLRKLEMHIFSLLRADASGKPHSNSMILQAPGAKRLSQC